VAVVRPDLFTYKKGVVRVETQGLCVGHTLMDQGLKRFVQIRNYYSYSLISDLQYFYAQHINWVSFHTDGIQATHGRVILLFQSLGL
jgi:inosine-uridine nucleoside N-ribohydrolase